MKRPSHLSMHALNGGPSRLGRRLRIRTKRPGSEPQFASGRTTSHFAPGKGSKGLFVMPPLWCWEVSWTVKATILRWATHFQKELGECLRNSNLAISRLRTPASPPVDRVRVRFRCSPPIKPQDGFDTADNKRCLNTEWIFICRKVRWWPQQPGREVGKLQRGKTTLQLQSRTASSPRRLVPVRAVAVRAEGRN